MQELIPKKGKFKAWHFAHKQASKCSLVSDPSTRSFFYSLLRTAEWLNRLATEIPEFRPKIDCTTVWMSYFDAMQLPSYSFARIEPPLPSRGDIVLYLGAERRLTIRLRWPTRWEPKRGEPLKPWVEIEVPREEGLVGKVTPGVLIAVDGDLSSVLSPDQVQETILRAPLGTGLELLARARRCGVSHESLTLAVEHFRQALAQLAAPESLRMFDRALECGLPLNQLGVVANRLIADKTTRGFALKSVGRNVPASTILELVLKHCEGKSTQKDKAILNAALVNQPKLTDEVILTVVNTGKVSHAFTLLLLLPRLRRAVPQGRLKELIGEGPTASVVQLLESLPDLCQLASLERLKELEAQTTSTGRKLSLPLQKMIAVRRASPVHVLREGRKKSKAFRFDAKSGQRIVANSSNAARDLANLQHLVLGEMVYIGTAGNPKSSGSPESHAAVARGWQKGDPFLIFEVSIRMTGQSEDKDSASRERLTPPA